MRRVFGIGLTLVFLVGLAGCGGDEGLPDVVAGSGVEAEASSQPESSAAPETSLPEQDTGTPEAEEQELLNTDFLALVGQPLIALRDTLGEEYFLHEIGSMTGTIEYYSPYVYFWFVPFWGNSGLPELDGNQDPFDGGRDTPIRDIGLQAEIDGETGRVTGPGSLQYLLNMQQPTVTYDALCEALGQQPTLESLEGGSYTVVRPYEVGNDWAAMPADTYRAEYAVQGLRLQADFVEQDGQLVAYSAFVTGEEW